MATIKQLEKALLKAEEAGNTDDVNEIKQLIFNKESQSSLAGGIARSAGQGLTFGFGDEIVAGVKAPFTDKTYREELELAFIIKTYASVINDCSKKKMFKAGNWFVEVKVYSLSGKYLIKINPV